MAFHIENCCAAARPITYSMIDQSQSPNSQKIAHELSKPIMPVVSFSV